MYHYSRWTMPVLRICMGLFLAAWSVDKLVANGMDLGAAALQAVGVAEMLLGVALAVGLFRVATAWIQLAVTAISTIASWKQILDPWGCSVSPTAAPISFWPRSSSRPPRTCLC